MSTWSTTEKIKILQLYTDKNSLWDERADTMEKLFGHKHPPGFFSIQSCRRELYRIFNQTNPAHVNGLPTHAQGREAAEMWLNHYYEELRHEQTKTKQMFAVGVRSIIDLVQKYKSGKLSADYLRQLRDQCRDADKDNQLVNDCVTKFLGTAKTSDLKNVSTPDDLLQFMRGQPIAEHPPSSGSVTPAAGASPLKSPLRSPVHSGRAPSSPAVAASPTRSVRTPIASPTRPSIGSPLAVADGVKSPPLVYPSQAAIATRSAAVQRRSTAPTAATTSTAADDSKMEVDETTAEADGSPPKQIQTRSSKRPSAAVGGSSTTTTRPERVRSLSTRSTTNTIVGGSSSEDVSTPLTPTVAAKSPTKRPSSPALPSSKEEEAAEEERLPQRKVAKVAVGVEKSDAKAAGTPISGRSTRTSSKVSVVAEAKEPPSIFPAVSVVVKELSVSQPATPTVAVVGPSPLVAATVSKPDDPTTPKPTDTSSTATAFSASQPTPKSSASAKRLRRGAAAASAPRRTAVTGTGYGLHELVGRVPLLNIWREISSHRVSSIFHAPVRIDDVPDYADAVKRPMDMTTIRRQIESGAIETFAQLNSAFVLMFANAIMFNSTDHDVNLAAKEMLYFALRHLFSAQYPCGEFDDITMSSSFQSTRRASRGVDDS